MSSILKALEKVEEARNPGRKVIPTGLAAGRAPRAAWVVPAGIAGGAVVATLVTFAAMGGFSRGSVADRPGKVAVASPTKSSAGPASPAAAPAQPQPQPAIDASPVKSAQIIPDKVAQQPAASKAKANSPSAHSVAPAARPRQVTAVTGATPAVAPVSVPTPSSAKEPTAPAAAQQLAPEKSPPQLRVTGIAWQKDGASSAALVNGRPVQQGGVVDGFKVEEIFQDKVRFSGGNGNLDVPLAGGE